MVDAITRDLRYLSIGIGKLFDSFKVFESSENWSKTKVNYRGTTTKPCEIIGIALETCDLLGIEISGSNWY